MQVVGLQAVATFDLVSPEVSTLAGSIPAVLLEVEVRRLTFVKPCDA